MLLTRATDLVEAATASVQLAFIEVQFDSVPDDIQKIFAETRFIAKVNELDNVVQDNIINAIENVDTSNVSTSSNEPEEDKPINFTLTAIGDTLCHNTQYWDAYNSDTKEYDFSYVYDDIKYYTKVADITVGSLETTFAGEDRGYSNYPTFNSPDSLAYALKKIGVDVISLAGNHAQQ